MRYRTSLDAAHVRCHLGTSWADRNGTHTRAFDVVSIDVLAVYCPSPRTFAYLLASELNASDINLRFSKAKNGQVKRTRDAAEHRDPWRMFGPVTGAGEALERPLHRLIQLSRHARIAQRIEQRSSKAKAGGSSPSAGANFEAAGSSPAGGTTCETGASLAIVSAASSGSDFAQPSVDAPAGAAAARSLHSP